MSISILIKLILFSKWCNFALVFATFKAFIDISIAVALHFGLSLIKERPKCTATAIDISKNAINVAKTNAKLHQLENKINFINIDIDKYKSYNYDLIISNPPYINSIDLKRLDVDIKFHEPMLALSGGSDGFRVLKKVILKSKKLLKINGKLILEFGHRQKDQCSKILNENGYYINQISKDLSGKDRCIVCTKL